MNRYVVACTRKDNERVVYGTRKGASFVHEYKAYTLAHRLLSDFTVASAVVCRIEKGDV